MSQTSRLVGPIVFFCASVAFAEARKPTPTPTATPTPSAASKKAPAPRVEKRAFTNDDLEAARKRPSNVQDLSATSGQTTGGSGSGYNPAPGSAPEAAPDQPPPAPTEDPQEAALAAAEERVRSLDQRAKELLWQFLQSTDTYEIARLKQEQQQVLNELEQAKADLARVRGETPAGSQPAAEPTRQPG